MSVLRRCRALAPLVLAKQCHSRTPWPASRHPTFQQTATQFREKLIGRLSTTSKVNDIVLDVSNDRRFVSLSNTNIGTQRYNATWLRHHCQCPSCFKEDTAQRTTDPADIYPTLTLKTVRIENDSLIFEWHEDPHIGSIALGYLEHLPYSEKSHEQLIKDCTPSFNKNRLARVTYDSIEDSEEGLWEWVHYLNDVGLCLVENIPKTTPINKIVEKLGPLQSQLYDLVFTVETKENPINLAYTSSELPFHMDLPYYESTPGYQFLLCQRFDDCIEGGETTFVDAWYEAERMRELYPEEFETLTRVPVTFHRVQSVRRKPVHLSSRRPHIVLESGQITSISWGPGVQSLLGVAEDDIEPYYKATHKFVHMMKVSDSKVTHRLREGEMICFNNRRYVHGRNGYEQNAGTRILKGCYLNIDDFKSTAEILSRKFNAGRPAKRVFNHCLV